MLAVGTWFLLGSAVTLFSAYIYKTKITRKRIAGEPPVVKGNWLLGSCIDFGNHAVEFLHKCEKAYGQVFTLRLFNQHLHVISDTHSYEAMSKEKNFDFDAIQKQVNWNVFSFVLKEPKKMIKDTGRTVKGPYLNKGMQTFTDFLQMSFDKHPASAKWSEDGLRAFTNHTMFNALFNTIFGQSDDHPFNSNVMYSNFEVFHQYFNMFWLGVPKNWFPRAMTALKGMLCQPTADQLMERPDTSDYIKTAVTYMREQGQTDADIMGHNLVYLHVNYNTFRLAFWALSYLLEDEKACNAVREEMNELINSRLDDDTNTAHISPEDLESLKILDSLVQESSRLCSGVFMVRFVTEDTWFTTSDGTRTMFRQGDRVAIYPPAHHKDPEVFEDPLTFKHDRFVDQKFYKNGQEIKTPIMAFGSLCPGKRYAILQLKWFLLAMLNRYEMKLEDGEHAQYDYMYHGHEILPPIDDVRCSYRLRENAPTIKFTNE